MYWNHSLISVPWAALYWLTGYGIYFSFMTVVSCFLVSMEMHCVVVKRRKKKNALIILATLRVPPVCQQGIACLVCLERVLGICTHKCFLIARAERRKAVGAMMCRVIYRSGLTLYLIWWCHWRLPYSYILDYKCLLSSRNAYILWICLHTSIHWCRLRLASDQPDCTHHPN